MNFPLVNYAGLQFRLLLVRPNWEVAPTVTHRADTIVGEGRTTIEERRPGRATWLLSQRVLLSLLGTDGDDWRKGLAALGSGRIAMPLWVDALPVSQWSTRIYEPQQVINFNPRTGDFDIYAAADLPAEPEYSHFAPLMLGRFAARPPATAETDSIADVEIELVEASPWSWRIGVHAHGDGWLQQPDRISAVVEASDYGLEQIRLAPAREVGLDRVNAAPRWTQEAEFSFMTRLEIRTALTVFAAKRGSWGTIAPLPAWFQPGASSPGTPDNYTARFASDSLTLRYRTPAIAEARIGFVQEVSTPGRDQALPGEAYLYQLAYAPAGAAAELFTSWDAPLVLDEGTYLPRQIAHQDILRSLKPQEERAEIQMEYVAGSLAADWIVGRLFGLVRLTIWKCDPDDPGGTRGEPLFAGIVQDVKPNGNTLTLAATLFGRVLERRVPGWVFSRRCNTYLFSPLCGLDVEDFKSEGTAAAADLSADGLTLTVQDADGWGGPAYPDNHFARGIVRTGAARDFMEATIISSAMESGALVLKLKRPFWADKLGAGVAVWLQPGCGGQWDADCGTRYNNQARNRSFPHIPEFLETRAGGAPNAPKK